MNLISLFKWNVLPVCSMNPWDYLKDLDTTQIPTGSKNYFQSAYAWMYDLCIGGIVLSLTIVITSYILASNGKVKAENAKKIRNICIITAIVFSFIGLANLLYYVFMQLSTT